MGGKAVLRVSTKRNVVIPNLSVSLLFSAVRRINWLSRLWASWYLSGSCACVLRLSTSQCRGLRLPPGMSGHIIRGRWLSYPRDDADFIGDLVHTHPHKRYFFSVFLPFIPSICPFFIDSSTLSLTRLSNFAVSPIKSMLEHTQRVGQNSNKWKNEENANQVIMKGRNANVCVCISKEPLCVFMPLAGS